MKSIKPGRGPSMVGGIMSIVVGLFGVVWTIIAASMGGGFMAIFGILFILVAIIQAIYKFKNATSENRYSEFDITDETEESDPLNDRFGRQFGPELKIDNKSQRESHFCPYCGTAVDSQFTFCNHCGKKLP